MSEREYLLPRGEHYEEPTLKASFKALVYSSKVNYLLLFVPIALAFSHASDSVVFSLNFMAIIPLAKLLGFGKKKRKKENSEMILNKKIATEEIALRSGSVVGSVRKLLTNVF